MTHGASALRSDPDELLTGRELRRLTARAAAARADAGPGEIVVDVAYAVVSVALATGWVVGLASMLRSTRWIGHWRYRSDSSACLSRKHIIKTKQTPR